jgi:hypothetical protein
MVVNTSTPTITYKIFPYIHETILRNVPALADTFSENTIKPH